MIKHVQGDRTIPILKEEEETEIVLKRLYSLNLGTIKSTDALHNENVTDTNTTTQL